MQIEDASGLAAQIARPKRVTALYHAGTRLEDARMDDLQRAQKAWAEQAGSRLSGLLRRIVHVEPVSSRPFSLSRARARLPHPGLAQLLRFAGERFQGWGLMDIDPALGLSMVDRLLGGAGTRGEQGREPTEIERHVLQRLWTEWVGILQNVLQECAPLRVTLAGTAEHRVDSPQAVDDAVIEWAFAVEYPHVRGTLRIVLANPVLWPWVAADVPAPPTEPRARVSQAVRRPVALEVEVGSQTLTAREVRALESGDIVRLESKAARGVLVKVDGRPTFWGRPCLVGGRVAVELDVPFSEEGEV